MYIPEAISNEGNNNLSENAHDNYNVNAIVQRRFRRGAPTCYGFQQRSGIFSVSRSSATHLQIKCVNVATVEPRLYPRETAWIDHYQVSMPIARAVSGPQSGHRSSKRTSWSGDPVRGEGE